MVVIEKPCPWRIKVVAESHSIQILIFIHITLFCFFILNFHFFFTSAIPRSKTLSPHSFTHFNFSLNYTLWTPFFLQYHHSLTLAVAPPPHVVAPPLNPFFFTLASLPHDHLQPHWFISILKICCSSNHHCLHLSSLSSSLVQPQSNIFKPSTTLKLPLR